MKAAQTCGRCAKRAKVAVRVCLGCYDSDSDAHASAEHFDAAATDSEARAGAAEERADLAMVAAAVRVAAAEARAEELSALYGKAVDELNAYDGKLDRLTDKLEEVERELAESACHGCGNSNADCTCGAPAIPVGPMLRPCVCDSSEARRAAAAWRYAEGVRVRCAECRREVGQ